MKNRTERRENKDERTFIAKRIEQKGEERKEEEKKTKKKKQRGKTRRN